MSQRNTRKNKRLRSMERAARKAEAAQRIPFLGVYRRKADVRQIQLAVSRQAFENSIDTPLLIGGIPEGVIL